MADRPERLGTWIEGSRAGRWGIGLGVLLVAGAVLWFALGQRGDAGVATGEQSVVVSPRPFSNTLTLVGTITPGEQTQLTAPFDGVVTSVEFDYGARIEQGQTLIALDVTELTQARNEAETAYLKAAQMAGEIADWPNGAEVSRARRGRDAAAADLRNTERQVEDTRRLLDRGLVSRNEYQGLVQQRANQQRSMASAEDDLSAALRRGQGPNRRIAALDLETTRARLIDLDGRLARAVITAPESGVMVRPVATDTDTATGVQVGQTLARGQLIGSIARSGDLAVTFRLDEADANRVRPGQPVRVTGPGFEGLTLTGAITDVAGEATASGSGASSKAIFDATARLNPLTADNATAVRIGMSANVTITLYETVSALVVPPQAVQGGPVEGSVTVRDPRTKVSRKVAVRLGRVAPDGVEILSGLKAGDEVIWTVPTSGPVTPG